MLLYLLCFLKLILALFIHGIGSHIRIIICAESELFFFGSFKKRDQANQSAGFVVVPLPDQWECRSRDYSVLGNPFSNRSGFYLRLWIEFNPALWGWLLGSTPTCGSSTPPKSDTFTSSSCWPGVVGRRRVVPSRSAKDLRGHYANIPLSEVWCG